ncbi:MAG: RtcB family protein [Myxococcales bacterium]
MSKNSRFCERLRRLDDARVSIDNDFDVPITLLASPEVPIEDDGLAQLFDVLESLATVAEIHGRERAGLVPAFWGESAGELRAVVLTPDFHRGATVPVGTVLDARGLVWPSAVGNDIGCGMRLLTLDVEAAELRGQLDALERRLRALFFEGGRDIPLSPRQREAMLRDGLRGLLAEHRDNAGVGAWRQYDVAEEERALARVHRQGSLPTIGAFSFADYVHASGRRDGRDPHIGSVGGGNHFVEIQEITPVEPGTAWAWGLARGRVAVQVHSGSLGFGHHVGSAFVDRARALHPTGVPRPARGFHALPLCGPLAAEGERYLDAQNAAANFAFANRLFLGLMAVRAVGEVLGREVSARLVWDAPHNLVFPDATRALHRKGACPADGPAPEDESDPYRFTGHPVLVPGSMGASSYVLAGAGNDALLASAAHGAGRGLTRGEAAHVSDEVFRRAMEPLRVVTPVDRRAPALQARRDILEKLEASLKEEAPFAYKPIEPIIATLSQAQVARPVARLWPMLTVKG